MTAKLGWVTVVASLSLMLVSIDLVSATALQQPAAPVCTGLIEYQDLDGDGQADAALIGCSLESGSDDHVLVVDGDGDMGWDAPWQEVADFEQDTWIFDHRADGRAELVIRFSRPDDLWLADLYDDQDGDGAVNYEIRGKGVAVTESDFWTVRVQAQGPWVQNGRINHNLKILVDGNVEAMFGSSTYRDSLTTDGQVDFVIDVNDPDFDGRPDYEFRRHQIQWRRNLVGEGFHLMVNWEDGEPLPDSLGFWPYLSAPIETTGSRVPKPFQYRPPIQVDWEIGQIVAVSEFVASRAGESNCFIYGSGELEPGQVVDAGFENPFCFYDLASDRDRVPEMQIRMEYWPASDPRFLAGTFPQDIEWIRYSWDQDNDASWDYGLGLAGRHSVESTITLGDYTLRTVDYESLPSWVTERAWDEAVFVDTEDTHYWTSEGIYAAQVPMTVTTYYLTGVLDEHPTVQLDAITPDGFRVEYAPDLLAPPLLYLSPVDASLHLFQSEEGLWKIDELQSLRYRDANGDGYVDQWQYLETDEVRQQVYLLPEHLVYAGDGRVVLKRAPVAPASFETAPPGNHEEWLALGEQLDRYRLDLAPDQLAAMLEQFDGPSTEIQGAMLRDVRDTSDGFRFVLQLQPQFQILGEDTLGIAGRLPGDYLVRYAGAFQSQPLTPPRLVVAPAGSLLAEPPIAYVPNRVQFEIGNEGLEDAPDVLATLNVSRNGGEPAETLSQTMTSTLSVLSGQSMVVGFNWTPRAQGSWTINLEARPSNSEAAMFEPAAVQQEVIVAAAAEGDFWQTLGAFGLVPPVWVLLLLGSTAVVGAGLGLILLRTLDRDPVELDS